MENIYDKLYEELNECPQDQHKEFLVNNYTVLMKLSYDQELQQFKNLKTRFYQFDSILNSVQEDLEDLQYARVKMNAIANSEGPLSSNSEELQSNKNYDQLTELLDNVTSASYDKNYSEAIQYYEILKDMLNNSTYASLLRTPEIKKTTEQCYKTLCELLLSDFESENPVFVQEDLISYLMRVDQHSELIQKYLSIKSKKLMNKLQQYFNSTFGLDLNLLERACQDFLHFLVQVSEEIEKKFQETNAFYQDIAPALFQSYDYNEILSTIKDLINQFNDYEPNGISLGQPLQTLIIQDTDLKLDELLQFYFQKTRVLMDNSQLITCFMLKSLNFCEDELQEQQLKPIGVPCEVKAKDNSTIKQIFSDTNQPCGAATVFFWNVCFSLIDATVVFLNPESWLDLSCSLVQQMQGKLRLFIKDYVRICRQSCANLLQPNQENVVFQVANTYASFSFCNILGQYIVNKKCRIQLTLQQEWVQLIQVWYGDLKDTLQTFFNGLLLEQLPYWFTDVGRIYCQKLEKPVRMSSKPSTLFLMIAITMSQIKQKLSSVIPRQALSYFLLLLHEQVKYVLEYIIYWSYHNLGKTQDVFFLDKKERDRLNFNLNHMNLYLQQNALKLSFFTEDGMIQFAFDVHFLANFLNKYLGVEGQTISEQFITKAVALYNKEKNSQIEIALSLSQYVEKIENYNNNSLSSDLMSLGVHLSKISKYPPVNFNFRQATNENV